MIYATYFDYASVYKGTSLDAQAFNSYIVQASAYLDFITFNRITEADELVIKAVCAVTEVLYTSDITGKKQSETVGKHSVHYAVNIKSARTVEREKYKAAKIYLGHTGLMRRGIG